MRVKSLNHCPVFASLGDADLKKIAELGVDREHEAGSIIFREGDAAEQLLIIQEGKVAVQMTLPAQTGKKITVDIAGTDDVVGWSAIIDPYVHTVTAVCLQKTKVLAISAAQLRSLLQSNHQAGYEVLKGLAKTVLSRLDDTRRLLITERSWMP